MPRKRQIFYEEMIAEAEVLPAQINWLVPLMKLFVKGRHK
jgi:hypothetical protein